MTHVRKVIQLLLVAILLSGALAIAQDSQEMIEIKTESAIITFSLKGAYPIAWDIIDPEFVDPGESVPLIYKDGDPDFPYPFRLILDGPNGELTKFANSAMYSHEESVAHEDTQIHTFISPVHSSGLQFSKQFDFHDRFHAIVTLVVENTSGESVKFDQAVITLGAGLGTIPGSIGGLGDSMYTYVDAIEFNSGNIEPFDFSDADSAQPFPELDTRTDWIGIHNRYYLMAFGSEPDVDFVGNALFPPTSDDSSIPGDAREFFPGFELNPGLEVSMDANSVQAAKIHLYAGPKDPNSLYVAGQDFRSVMYYNLPNWMRWITFKVGWLLNKINGVVHVWWITLLVLVVIVRVALFPLAQKAIKMNAQMLADQSKLKPEIEAIKKKHKDPTKQHQKTMELYKEHDINPFAPMLGCLPVLFQLPILIAIFNLLGQEVKMQGATFLWVKDLSIPDQLLELPFTLPYFGSYFNLLPVLMSVTMVLTTNMGTPAVGDQKKSQMRSMIILAFIFFALFYSFPAGLVLYWMMSNIGQYIQQEVMARRTLKVE